MRNKKRKFVFQIIIVIVPVFIFFNLLFFNQIKENYVTNFYEVGENITSQTSRVLSFWIQDQINLAKIIAKNNHIIDACRYPEDEGKIMEANAFLKEIHGIYTFYENFPLSVKLEKPINRVVNGKTVEIKNGEFLTDTVDGVTVGKGGVEYSYIQEIFDGKEYYISEIYPSIFRNNPILVISVPIKYETEIIGVAIVSPQIELFTKEFVDNVAFKDTGYLFFIDDRNITISHPERELILSNEINIKKINSEIIGNFNSGVEFFNEEFIDEKKFYFVKDVDIPEENIADKWYIVFTETEKEVLRDSNRYLLNSLTMSVLVLYIVVFLIYVISKMNQKEIYEEKLETMNKCLENKVEERTKELKKMTMIDGLTQLYNYKTAYSLLKETISNSSRTGSSFVLIIADLDNFKCINDTHGHLIGNEVLMSTARLISFDVRNNDIVGRYGGEEFMIVLKNITVEGAFKRAESMRKKIEKEAFSIEALKVTISMGICEWHGESASELIKKADEAMYKAKRNGKNRVER